MGTHNFRLSDVDCCFLWAYHTCTETLGKCCCVASPFPSGMQWHDRMFFVEFEGMLIPVSPPKSPSIKPSRTRIGRIGIISEPSCHTYEFVFAAGTSAPPPFDCYVTSRVQAVGLAALAHR